MAQGVSPGIAGSSTFCASPEGAPETPGATRLPPLRGSHRFATVLQGLTPLAIDCHPFGAERDLRPTITAERYPPGSLSLWERAGVRARCHPFTNERTSFHVAHFPLVTLSPSRVPENIEPSGQFSPEKHLGHPQKRSERSGKLARPTVTATNTIARISETPLRKSQCGKIDRDAAASTPRHAYYPQNQEQLG